FASVVLGDALWALPIAILPARTADAPSPCATEGWWRQTQHPVGRRRRPHPDHGKSDGAPPVPRRAAGAGIRETSPRPPHATIAPWQFRFAAPALPRAIRSHCRFASHLSCQGRTRVRVPAPHPRLSRYVAHRSETRSPPRSIGLLGAIQRLAANM